MKNRKFLTDEWKKDNESKIETAEKAVSRLKPGQRIFIGTGCGQPRNLVDAMTKKQKDLSDVEIIDFLTTGSSSYLKENLDGSFRINSFFLSYGSRDTIRRGVGDYTPIFLSDIPPLFSSGQLPLDVAMIQVSPPDDKGRCSLGISVDIVKSAAETAGIVIAQVNKNMPYTAGDSTIHMHDIDVLVPSDEDLIEVEPITPDKDTEKIGQFVAALIEDGSTIEFGIGAIPQAVARYLYSKKDLGIHTEMFTDTIIDLIEKGVVNGSNKSMDRNKVVASFCMGTKKIYDYIDKNTDFAFYPTEHVNDPFTISKQTKQVAINVALEVDLSGQVCSDSIGTEIYSGIGGQVDFNRGAAKSPGGKAIIALKSTAKNGTISRIKANLSPGAGVVTSRGDVHYVITEYGTAYLHGKSIRERAIALISIAHPDFRETLLKDAIKSGMLNKEYEDTASGFYTNQNDYASGGVLSDGTLIHFRSIRPVDEPAIKDLFYNLSEQTIYYRFMSRMQRLPSEQMKNFIYINPRTDVAIVATLPEAYGDEIVGVGRYYLDETDNMAEVAFTVRDSWQNHGIGTMLFEKLSAIAKSNAISGFKAEVLSDNYMMQSVLNKSADEVTSKRDDNSITYRIKF